MSFRQATVTPFSTQWKHTSMGLEVLLHSTYKVQDEWNELQQENSVHFHFATHYTKRWTKAEMLTDYMSTFSRGKKLLALLYKIILLLKHRSTLHVFLLFVRWTQTVFFFLSWCLTVALCNCIFFLF